MDEHLRRDDDNPSEMSPRDRSPEWGPRHLDIHRGKTPEPVDHLHSDFAAVGTNYWFVWPEGNWPPTEPGFSKVFLHSVTDGVFVPCRCRLWLAQLGTLHFQHNHRLDCTDFLNWTKLDNAITKFNNEMHSADNWVLNPVILHYWQIAYFDIVQCFVTICIVKGAI